MSGEVFFRDFFSRYASPKGLAEFHRQRFSYRDSLHALAAEIRADSDENQELGEPIGFIKADASAA